MSCHPVSAVCMDTMVLDGQQMRDGLATLAGHPGFLSALETGGRQALLSGTGLRLAEPVVVAVQRAVQRIQAQRSVMAAGGCPGVLGFDLHLAADGPKLIEVNTNPGGLLIAALQTWAALRSRPDLVPACAMPLDRIQELACLAFAGQAGDGTACGAVAIVDDAPQQQFLWPEFLLYQAALQRQGRTVRIVDPADLLWDGQCLRHRQDGLRFGAVYNRLTDFSLTEPAHQALSAAHAAHAVRLCPDPSAHRLWADKSRLVDLAGCDDLLPFCVAGHADNWEQLWKQRRDYYFKPRWGYGGKGVYRGDKITRTVWQSLRPEQMIAQQVVPPPRVRLANGDWLKADLRAFAADGQVLLLAARLYQGQTTNFRTPGGGFAPLFLGQ